MFICSLLYKDQKLFKHDLSTTNEIDGTLLSYWWFWECFTRLIVDYRAGLLFRLSQGSIVKLLSFNLCICYIFYKINKPEYDSFPEDTTSYTRLSGLVSVLTKLQKEADKVFTWFNQNIFRANFDNLHQLISYTAPENIKAPN